MEAIGSGASFLDQGLFGQFVALHGSSSKLFSISTQACLSCGQVMSLNGFTTTCMSPAILKSFEAILPANYESDTSPSHFLYALFQIILINVGMGQNPIPLVHIKIAGKWMFIPLKMVCIGIDP